MELSPVPGFAPTPKQIRTRGIALVVTVLLAILAVWGYNRFGPNDDFLVDIRTPTVAAGITEGSVVRISGLEVGAVAAITRADSGQQKVSLRLAGPEGRSLTDNVAVDFSAGNLFGISEVILTPREGGAQLSSGDTLAPVREISDSTVSNMIATIGDINNDAVRPYASQIFLNFDSSTRALLPLFTALGNVTQAVQDTQRLSTAETFPQITEILAAADFAAGASLSATSELSRMRQHFDGTTPLIQQTLHDGINDVDTGFVAGVGQILSPAAIDGLRTSSPILVDLLQPLLDAFPNGSARGVGIQFGQLLDNIRLAMPDGPDGPTLNVSLQLYYPAIAAALPPGTLPAATPEPAG